MPVATGLLFLPLFSISAWLLEQLPPPTKQDEETRVQRRPMPAADRRRFLRYFAYGVVTQLIVYVVLTAFRDFRDIYAIDIWKGLDLDQEAAIFTKSESWVALATVGALVLIRLFDSRKWGAVPNLALMLLGFILIGGSTLLFQQGALSGFTWMVLIGIGGYLGYVPCDTIFYERVIVSSGWVGTAVFMAYVMDASGYTGSVALQLYKAFGSPEMSYVAFFGGFCYVVTFLGVVIVSVNMWYFPWRARQARMHALERAAGGGTRRRGPQEPAEAIIETRS
jgi:hypothetical protein